MVSAAAAVLQSPPAAMLDTASDVQPYDDDEQQEEEDAPPGWQQAASSTQDDDDDDSSSSEEEDEAEPPAVPMDEEDDSAEPAAAVQPGVAPLARAPAHLTAGSPALAAAAADDDAPPPPPSPWAVNPHRAVRKNKSPADPDLMEGNVIFFDVDIEQGGPECGIIQLSCVASDQDGVKLAEFDECVKPSDGAVRNEAPEGMCHGLSPYDPRVVGADPITLVWPQFVLWVEGFLNGGQQRGCFTAWAGKGEWLHRVTDIDYVGQLFQPRWCPYFWDPVVCLTYAKCQLKPLATANSGGVGLASAYRHVTGKGLEGAHSSIVDARGQWELLRMRGPDPQKECMMPLANTPRGIVLLETVYKAKRMWDELYNIL
jgi:hypothetical protein